jgi:hypothetical protein
VTAGAAEAGLSLLDRLPAVGELTGLVGLLRGQAAGVELAAPPQASVGELAAGFRLSLPDPASWSQLAVPDPAALLGRLPDPAALAKPLAEPIGRVRAILDLGVTADLDRIAAQIGGIQAPSQDSPAAFLRGLFAPAGDLGDLVRDSALLRLVVELGRLLGLPDAEHWPEDAGALGVLLRDALEHKLGNTLLAVVGLASAATVASQAERLVAAATGWFSLPATQARFQAVLEAYGDGPDGLAGRLLALDPNDAEQLAAAGQRLAAAGTTFDAYVQDLERDLAFSEASLALVDAAALRDALERTVETLAAVDTGQLASLAESLRRAAQAVADLPGGAAVDLAGFKAQVASHLGELRSQLDRLDPERLPDLWESFVGRLLAPLERLRALQRELEGVVRGAYQSVHDAVATVDLAGLRGSVERAMAQLEAQLDDLDQLVERLRPAIGKPLEDAGAALAGARQAIMDPDTGVKRRLDDLLGQAVAVLEDLHLDQAVAKVQAALEPISGELAKVQFAPAMDAALEVIGTAVQLLRTVLPLLVTDDLKRQLAEAAQVLRQVDLGQVREELLQGFDEIVAGVDEDALALVRQQYRRLVETVGQLDPVPAVEAVQREVFDPLLAEAEQLDPAALLDPVTAAFGEAVEALASLHPAEALSFLGELFQELLAKLPELSPARLLGPSEQAVAELRAGVEGALGLDRLERLLDDLLAPLTALLDGLDPARVTQLLDGFTGLRQAVAGFDPAALAGPVTATLRQLFAATGAAIDRAGVTALLESVRDRGGLGGRVGTLAERLRATEGELRRLELRAALETLRQRHDAVAAALGRLEAAGAAGRELAAAAQALDPLPRLAPLLAGQERVQAAFADTAAALGQVTDDLAGPLGAVDTVLESLAGLLAPLPLLEGWFRELGGRLLPGRAPGSLRDLLLGLLDELDPRQWSSEIEALAAAAHAKASALLGQAVVDPLRRTLARLRDSLGLLDLSGLTGPLEAAYAELEAAVRQLDPAPLVAALGGTHDRLVASLRRLDPAPFVAELSRLYADDVLGVLRALSPETLLLPGLRAAVARIEGLLVAVDVDQLFAPVLELLGQLRQQLDEGLQRVEDAYGGLTGLLDSAA